MKLLIFCISIALYLCYLAGIVLCFSNSFSAFVGFLSLKRRLPKKINIKEQSLIEKLDALLFSINGKENKGKRFLISTIAIFFFVFLFAMFYYSLVFSLIIALLCALLPFLYLFVRLKEQRGKGAKEGRSFVMALYREYRMENKNIYIALEKVSANKEEFPICSKQAFNLLLRLRASANVLFIKKSCKDFSYAIGSAWAKIVSICIASACDGADIGEALLGVCQDLKLEGFKNEEKKRLNAESTRMASFMVPALYIGSLILSINYMGISIGSLIKNQFFTKIGFLLFILSALLFVIDLLVLRYVNNTAN